MNSPINATGKQDGGSCIGDEERQGQDSVYAAAIRLCCSKCCSYLKPNYDEIRADKVHVTPLKCWLCLGLWQKEEPEEENSTDEEKKCLEEFKRSGIFCLRRAIEEACSPYGGIGRKSGNRFSRMPNQTHTVSLSGDLCLRYKWLASFSSNSHVPFSVYLQDLKQHLHSRIKSIIDKDDENGEKDCNREKEKNAQSWKRENHQVFEVEEQGCLSIHLLCLPPKDYPMALALNKYMKTNAVGKKTKNQRNRYNKRQKCGPFTTQGGDPRQNLEVRLRSKGYEWISQSTAEQLSASLSSSQASPSLAMLFLNDSAPNNSMTMTKMEYQVAVFRRPMYLYGYYTKSRRDVSQTPFVVMREKLSSPAVESGAKSVANEEYDAIKSNNDGGVTAPLPKKEAQTLGATSVEEQICGPIKDLLGVSTRNNITLPDSNDSLTMVGNTGGGGGVLYGMIKFHASGREDMDVRMLVRSNSPTCHGRPFCVQIIDALKGIASPIELKGLIETINHSSAESKTTTALPASRNDSGRNEGVSYYGKNPMGVGISPDIFRVVPAATFSGLQGDTESKTKHYGCYCWSKNTLPFDDNGGNELTQIIFKDLIFPLAIQQKTPVRVMHRRSNSVRDRNVLDAKATRVDDHHFRLELSTQAGTYVKEFVYGDFGRTIPSVSSLMGCKTNLLELDCEGIEIPFSS